MSKISGQARAEHEALRTMAKGAHTALAGLINFDKLVSRKKAKAAVLSKQYRLDSWPRRFNMSLKAMLNLMASFSEISRHPQFSQIKKRLFDLIVDE